VLLVKFALRLRICVLVGTKVPPAHSVRTTKAMGSESRRRSMARRSQNAVQHAPHKRGVLSSSFFRYGFRTSDRHLAHCWIVVSSCRFVWIFSRQWSLGLRCSSNLSLSTGQRTYLHTVSGHRIQRQGRHRCGHGDPASVDSKRELRDHVQDFVRPKCE
jgi:hypothetical protein